MEKNPCVNLYEIKTFKQIRLRKDIQFQQELENSFAPFGTMFKYCNKVTQRQRNGDNSITLDYAKLLKMLPDEISFHKRQLKHLDDFKQKSYDQEIKSRPKMDGQLKKLHKNMMMSIDQNLSGFQKKAGE
jgi:hypothetical protein